MSSGTPFERSHNTRRAVAGSRPRLRGLMHRVAAVLAVPAAVWLVVSAPPGAPRVVAAVFGATIAFMFVASAVVHYRDWHPDTFEVLFRLDHTGIYLAIAGTATPIAVLGLDGWQQAVLLWGAWVVAVAGIVIEWLPSATPRGVAQTLYLVLGWTTVPLLPWIHANTGWSTTGLLLAGGVLYTVGAIIVALRRPDPRPDLFGYHEIWHLLVVAAVVLHYAMVSATLLPAA